MMDLGFYRDTGRSICDVQADKRLVVGYIQVSFGVHVTEEGAARQYDRALLIVKGRMAKTNFPTCDYEREVAEYEDHLMLK